MQCPLPQTRTIAAIAPAIGRSGLQTPPISPLVVAMVGSLTLCSLAAAAPRLAAQAPRVAPHRAAAVTALLAQRPKRAQTARRCFFSSVSAQVCPGLWMRPQRANMQVALYG